MTIRNFIDNHRRLIVASMFLVLLLVIQVCLIQGGILLQADPGGNPPTPSWP